MARIELVWFVFVVEMNRVMGNDILLFFVRCECFLAFFCLVLLHLDIEHLERVLPFFSSSFTQLSHCLWLKQACNIVLGIISDSEFKLVKIL